MKRIYIVALAAVLATLCGCRHGGDELEIISFNIRYNSWYDIDGENRWANRRDAVVRMIEEERPAALGLQEALIDQLLYLDSCLPEYRRVGVGRDDGMEAGEFMAIYYDTMRLELLRADTRWLSETPEVPSKGWDAACYRTVTVACFQDKKSGKRFVYLNTHLDHMGKVARSEGAKLIASLTHAENECFDWPVVLGGDMNATIDDTAVFNRFYAVGLQDAREMTDSTSHAVTYNAFGGLDQSGNGVDARVIDHFFVRDAQVLCFRTLDGDYGVPYISDHYPIAVTIRR